MSVREALLAPGGVEELMNMIEVRYYALPGGVKVGFKLVGIPSTWKATLDTGEVISEGTYPDTWVQYGFIGEPGPDGEALDNLTITSP